jgi:hypothetical protein
MLTKVQKDAIRGMLADKQSVKTIAEEQGVSVEEVENLKPPKPVRLARAPEPLPAPLRRRRRLSCASRCPIPASFCMRSALVTHGSAGAQRVHAVLQGLPGPGRC